MKRIAFILSLLTVSWLSVSAQDIKTALKSMPEKIFPLLSRNNILDFIDFKDSNMKAEVTNNLKGKSEMTELTATSCHIRLTAHSEVDISIVNIDGKDLILVTRTYSTDEKKSQTQTYFTLDWQEQKKDMFR